MKRSTAILALLIATAPTVGYTDSAPDARTIANQGLGAAVAPCSSCHGPDGSGNRAAGFPRLAGVGARYLAEQLDAFASGARANPIMQPIAAALSRDQRHALADYYSEQAVPAADSQAGSGGTHENTAGRELAEHGRWADGVPACVQCHGPGGTGVGEHFPPLAGQPAAYIENQLRAWRKDARPGGPMDLMGAIADRLQERDLAPVARYFAALPATIDPGGDHE